MTRKRHPAPRTTPLGGTLAAPARPGEWRPASRTLAGLVLAGIVLYVIIAVALVFLRPRFSVLHNAESDYGSAGSWAWLMDLAFLLRGLVSVAAVRALVLTSGTVQRRGAFRVGVVLVLVWALCSASLAVVPDDAVGSRPTPSGAVHVLLALVAFLTMLVGAILVSGSTRHDRSGHPSSTLLLVVAWAAAVPLLLLGRAGFRVAGLGGLWERVFLALELLWLALAAVHAARRRLPTHSGATGLSAPAP